MNEMQRVLDLIDAMTAELTTKAPASKSDADRALAVITALEALRASVRSIAA